MYAVTGITGITIRLTDGLREIGRGAAEDQTTTLTYRTEWEECITEWVDGGGDPVVNKASVITRPGSQPAAMHQFISDGD